MRFVICGAGAVGTTIGGYLAHTGKPVLLISRPGHAASIQRSGLVMKTSKGVLRPSLAAVGSPREVEWQADDILFLTTKSQHTKELLGNLDGAPEESPVFCFQNGVRNEEWAARRFRNVYGGLVQISANFIEPGVIEHTRNDVLALGKYPDGLDDVTGAVGSALTAAGFQMTYYESVMPHKWGKLLVNLNNAFYALVDTWLQRAYTERETREFFAATMNEGLQVIAAAGIEIAMGPGEPTVEEFIRQMAAGAYAYQNPWDLPPERRTYPSTWQDVVLRRGTTEVEHFNGEIVDLGKRFGVPTPYNSALLEMMRELLRQGAMPGLFTMRDVRARVESYG
jgi:2-dehydropantoate 2-reductase